MIKRLFNIYTGEEKRAGLFALLAFLWSLGGFMGVLLTEAVLLLHAGAEALPATYIVTAATLILFTFILLKLVEDYSQYHIFLGAAALTISFYLGYMGLLHLASGSEELWSLWVITKALGYVLHLLLTMSFWAFVDQYFDLQDSKRLFVLFSSSIFAGAACAGWMLEASILDADQIAIFVCLLIAGAGTVAWVIGRSLQRVYDDTTLEGRAADPVSLRGLIKAIMSSRFTMMLLFTYLLQQVITFITDFHYLSGFEAYTVPDAGWSGGEPADAALTRFLGSATLWVSVVNLIFGLFIYSRLVKRVGINNMIPALPLTYLILYSGWIFYQNSLLFALAGFSVVEGLLYIVDDNTYNLCLNAVPGRIKNKVRILVESVFEPAGMVIAALLLWIPGMPSFHIGLALALFGLLVALVLRRTYQQELYSNLQRHTLCFGRSMKEQFRQLSSSQLQQEVSRLRHYAQSGSTGERHLAAEALKRLEGVEEAPELPPLLKKYAEHGGEEGLNTLLQAAVHMRPAERRQAEAVLLARAEECTAALREAVADAALHDRSRILAARALGGIDPQGLQEQLAAYVEEELVRARLYLYHSLTIQQRYADLDLHALVDALRTGFHSTIDCVIQFIGSAACPDRAEVLAHSLRSRNDKVRSHALEMLEEICTPAIFQQVEMLVDDVVSREELLRICQVDERTRMSLDDLLRWLAERPSSLDQIISYAMQAQLRIDGWEQRLKAEMQRNDEALFQHFAKELMEPPCEA